MATKCESIVIFISLYYIIIQSSVITGNVIISESQDPPPYHPWFYMLGESIPGGGGLHVLWRCILGVLWKCVVLLLLLSLWSSYNV